MGTSWKIKDMPKRIWTLINTKYLTFLCIFTLPEGVRKETRLISFWTKKIIKNVHKMWIKIGRAEKYIYCKKKDNVYTTRYDASEMYSYSSVIRHASIIFKGIPGLYSWIVDKRLIGVNMKITAKKMDITTWKMLNGTKNILKFHSFILKGKRNIRTRWMNIKDFIHRDAACIMYWTLKNENKIQHALYSIKP